jgi:ferredoxin
MIENRGIGESEGERTVRVQVDRDRCCSSGQCVVIAPQVFDQRDEDGTVVLKLERPPVELHEEVREAEDLCPGNAIRVDEG